MFARNNSTVKPVLRDHCHERPPVLTDHTFLAEAPTFQHNNLSPETTCLDRLHVCGQWGGLLRQVLLYFIPVLWMSPGTKFTGV